MNKKHPKLLSTKKNLQYYIRTSSSSLAFIFIIFPFLENTSDAVVFPAPLQPAIIYKFDMLSFLVKDKFIGEYLSNLNCHHFRS